MDTLQHCRWQPYPDAEALAQAAVGAIQESAAAAIAERGVFHLVLAGGNTPRRVYELLRDTANDWARWQLWFGDERCLPAQHPERNSRMAADAWLRHVPLPTENLHVMRAELGAEQAARDYARLVQSAPRFDLVLLGLGEDGHTASLFPGHDWGIAPDSPNVFAVYDAPKPPPERVSLSAQRLSAAQRVLFLVTGASKAAAVAAWRRGEPIPAGAIRPAAGVDVYLEQVLLAD